MLIIQHHLCLALANCTSCKRASRAAFLAALISTMKMSAAVSPSFCMLPMSALSSARQVGKLPKTASKRALSSSSAAEVPSYTHGMRNAGNLLGT